MKKSSFPYALVALLLVLLACGPSHPTRGLALDANSVCAIGPDGVKQCEPLGGKHMVLIGKQQDTCVLGSLVAPTLNDHSYSGEFPELADLHDALVEREQIFDFAPATTRMDWKGNSLMLTDTRDDKVILQQATSSESIILVFDAGVKDMRSLAIMEQAACQRSLDIDSMFADKPEVNQRILCGIKDLCTPGLGDLNGPVITVVIDQIIGDNPNASQLSYWTNRAKRAIKEKIFSEFKGSADWRVIRFPINDPRAPVFIEPRGAVVPTPADMRFNWMDVCEIRDPGVKMRTCDNDVLFEIAGKKALVIPVFGRQILIRKEPIGLGIVSNGVRITIQATDLTGISWGADCAVR